MSSDMVFSIVCALIGLLGLLGICVCGKESKTIQVFAAVVSIPCIRNVILPAYFYVTQYGYYEEELLPAIYNTAPWLMWLMSTLALMLFVCSCLPKHPEDPVDAAGSHAAASYIPTKQGNNASPPPAPSNALVLYTATNNTSAVVTLSLSSVKKYPTSTGKPNSSSANTTSKLHPARPTNGLLTPGKQLAASTRAHKVCLIPQHTTESRQFRPNISPHTKVTPPQAPGPDGGSLTAEGSDEAAIASNSTPKPAHSVGDAYVQPQADRPEPLWSRKAPWSEWAALHHAESDESNSKAPSTAISSEEYKEKELPRSVGDWADLVKKMEALSLGADLCLEKKNHRPCIDTSTSLMTIQKEETKPSIPVDPVVCLADMVAGLSLGTDLRPKEESYNVFVPFRGTSSSLNRLETRSAILANHMASLSYAMAALSIGTHSRQSNEDSYYLFKPFLGHFYSIEVKEGTASYSAIERGSPEKTEPSPSSTEISKASTATSEPGDSGYCSGEAEESASSTQTSADEQPSVAEAPPVDAPDANMEDLEVPPHEQKLLQEVDQGDGSSDTDRSAGESTDTDSEYEWENALPHSPMDDTGMNNHSTSDDDDLAQEIDTTNPPVHYTPEETNDNLPTDTGTPANRSLCRVCKNFSVANDDEKGMCYFCIEFGDTATSATAPISAEDSQAVTNGPTTEPSSTELRRSSLLAHDAENEDLSEDLDGTWPTQSSQVGEENDEVQDGPATEKGVLEILFLYRECKEYKNEVDNVEDICFDCSVHGEDAASKATPSTSPPTKDTNRPAEEPEADSGNTKRRRESVSSCDDVVDDESDDMDHVQPSKRGRQRDDDAATTMAAFAQDPMYPTEAFHPLNNLSEEKAQVQIIDWIERTVKTIETWNNNYRELEAQDIGSATRKMKTYLHQSEVRQELDAIVHRSRQINDYGSESPEGWDLWRITDRMVEGISDDYKNLEDGLHKLATDIRGDIIELSIIRGEFQRFMELTSGVVPSLE